MVGTPFGGWVGIPKKMTLDKLVCSFLFIAESSFGNLFYFLDLGQEGGGVTVPDHWWVLNKNRGSRSPTACARLCQPVAGNRNLCRPSASAEPRANICPGYIEFSIFLVYLILCKHITELPANGIQSKQCRICSGVF